MTDESNDEPDILLILMVVSLISSCVSSFFVPLLLFGSSVLAEPRFTGASLLIGIMLGGNCCVCMAILIAPLLELLKNMSFQGNRPEHVWMKFLIDIIIIFLSVVPGATCVALYYVTLAFLASIHFYHPYLMLFIFIILPYGFVFLLLVIDNSKLPPVEMLKNFIMKT